MGAVIGFVWLVCDDLGRGLCGVEVEENEGMLVGEGDDCLAMFFEVRTLYRDRPELIFSPGVRRSYNGLFLNGSRARSNLCGGVLLGTGSKPSHLDFRILARQCRIFNFSLFGAC